MIQWRLTEITKDLREELSPSRRGSTLAQVGGAGLQHHQQSDAFKAVQGTDPRPDRTLRSHPGLRDWNKT